MKILRVINSLNIGGAERSVVGNVPVHIKNGFNMDVLLLNGKETFFKQELEKKGVKVYSLEKNNNIYNPFLIFKLLKYLKKYDIIHVSLFPALYWVGFAKMFSFSNVKLIYTEHNTENRRRNNFVLKIIDKIIYKQYNQIVAISPETNENLSKHINEKNKISTIYNGVDINKIKTEAKTKLNDLEQELVEKKIIVQVAGFREEKDQPTVIKALTLLPNDYHVIFVGDGATMKSCVALAKEKNVYDRITFLGIQENVGAVINLADIVVVSSFSEGFGRASVEGMALGKPLIASNVSGLSTIVNGAGLLFEVGDYKKLSELIMKLMNDKKLYQSIAEKCTIRAEEYDISKMIQQYEKMYLNLKIS